MLSSSATAASPLFIAYRLQEPLDHGVAADHFAGRACLAMGAISQGETVNLSAKAAAGKVTVCAFGARWCGP